MIKLIETGEFPDLSGFSDIISLKHRALFALYGKDYGIYTSWYQSAENKITALIFSFAGAVSVSCRAGADTAEIKEFLKKVTGTRVFCQKSSAEILGGKIIRENTVMKFVGPRKLHKKTLEILPVNRQKFDYETLYRILKSGADGEISLPRFEDWYVDFCHRFRHGFADAVINEKNTSAAVISLKHGDFALVGGVCTEPKSRKKGEARRCLLTLIENTGSERQIFSIAAKGTEEFYEKCGFIPFAKYCLTETDNIGD